MKRTTIRFMVSKLLPLLTILVSFLTVWTLPVLANSEKVMPFVVVDSESGITSVIGNINREIQREIGENLEPHSQWQALYYNASNKRVSFDRDGFNKNSQPVRKRIMEIALAHLSPRSSTGIGSRDRARLYTFVESQDRAVARLLQAVNKDIHADVGMALKVSEVLRSPFNNLLGVLVMILSAMIALQIALDMLMLNTPPLLYLAQKKWGGKKPPFMSPEAWHSYRDIQQGNEYRDYFLSYFKRSVPKMFLTGLCVAYILFSNIATLAVFFADLFSR